MHAYPTEEGVTMFAHALEESSSVHRSTDKTPNTHCILRDVCDQAFESMLLVNSRGLVVHANAAAGELFRCDPGDMAGMWAEDLLGRGYTGNVARDPDDSAAPPEGALILRDGTSLRIRVRATSEHDGYRAFTIRHTWPATDCVSQPDAMPPQAPVLQESSAAHAALAAAANGLNIESMIELVLEFAVQSTGARAANILLRDESGAFAYRGGTDPRVARHQKIKFGAGPAGKAVKTGRPALVTRTADHGARLNPLNGLPEYNGYAAVPLIANGVTRGVAELYFGSAQAPGQDWADTLQRLSELGGATLDNACRHQEITAAYDATIAGWSRALDLRDKETEGHSQRVMEMTLSLAREMGVSDTEHIARGALLHDVGKLGIPDSILLKAETLSRAEWEVIRMHPEFAREMLSPIEYLRPALEIPCSHHEMWDGTGYPQGLKGTEIPLAARIFAVADVWESLSSDRPYRKRWPAERIREHITALAGTHFDPDVVDAFVNLREKMLSPAFD